MPESPSRASFLINGVGGGIVSFVLFNNALESLQASRRQRNERTKRPNAVVRSFVTSNAFWQRPFADSLTSPHPRDLPLAPKQLASWFSIDMDNAELIGFGNVGGTDKGNGKSRNSSCNAKGVRVSGCILLCVPLYSIALIGRFMKRKVTKAALRVVDNAVDQIAERAVQILRDDLTEERLEELVRAHEATTGEQKSSQKDQEGPPTSDEKVADSPAISTTEVALQCELPDKKAVQTESTLLVHRDAGFGYQLTEVPAKVKVATTEEPSATTKEEEPSTPPATEIDTPQGSPWRHFGVFSPPVPPGWDLVEDGSDTECA